MGFPIYLYLKKNSPLPSHWPKYKQNCVFFFFYSLAFWFGTFGVFWTRLTSLFFLTCFSFFYLHNTLYLEIGRDHIALPRRQWLWICNEKLLLSCLQCWKCVFSRNLTEITLKTITTKKKNPAQPQKASLKRKIQTLSVPLKFIH